MKRALLAVCTAFILIATNPAQASCDLSSTMSGGSSSNTINFCGLTVTLDRYYTETEIKAASTLSGTINGLMLTLSATAPVSTLSLTNSVTINANGRTAVLSTTEPNFHVGGGGKYITLTIDGTVMYQGIARDISPQDAINVLEALGLYDSYAAVQQTVSRSEARTTTTLTANRISSILATTLSPMSDSQQRRRQQKDQASLADAGLSTGETEKGVGLWASPSNSWISSSDPWAKFSGTMQNMMSGIDYKMSQDSLVGLAVGFENTDIDTKFNSGTVNNEAISFTPYVGVGFFDRRITWDFMGSYAYYSGTQKREYSGSQTVKGEYTGQRWMLSSDLNGNLAVTDHFALTPTVGAMVAWDHRFRFYESDGSRPLKNDSGVIEGKLALRGTYALETIDLYGIGAFLHDFLQDQDITAPDQHTPRNEVMATLGMSYSMSDQETLSLELSNSFLRQYTHQTSLSANYRYTF